MAEFMSESEIIANLEELRTAPTLELREIRQQDFNDFNKNGDVTIIWQGRGGNYGNCPANDKDYLASQLFDMSLVGKSIMFMCANNWCVAFLTAKTGNVTTNITARVIESFLKLIPDKKSL